MNTLKSACRFCWTVSFVFLGEPSLKAYTGGCFQGALPHSIHHVSDKDGLNYLHVSASNCYITLSHPVNTMFIAKSIQYINEQLQ